MVLVGKDATCPYRHDYSVRPETQYAVSGDLPNNLSLWVLSIRAKIKSLEPPKRKLVRSADASMFTARVMEADSGF